MLSAFGGALIPQNSRQDRHGSDNTGILIDSVAIKELTRCNFFREIGTEMNTYSAESAMLASGVLCGTAFPFLLNIIRCYYPKTIHGASEWICATVALSAMLVVYSGAIPFIEFIKFFLGRLLFLIGMSLVLLGLRRFSLERPNELAILRTLMVYVLFVMVGRIEVWTDDLSILVTMLLANYFAYQSLILVRKLPCDSLAEGFVSISLIALIVIFSARLVFAIIADGHVIKDSIVVWALNIYTYTFIVCFIVLVCGVLVMAARSLRSALISAHAYYQTDALRNAERSQLAEELRMAIERRQLEMHYQARVDIEKGIVVGAEALVRWNHPIMGYVPPDKFIPIAEESDFIQRLGAWVIEESMACAARLKDKNFNIKVSINISAKQLAMKNFVEIVRSAVEAAGITPDMIELELTETVAIKNADSAIATLQKLQGIGLDVSIDDFGTGYSALSYLTRLPVSCLKLDKSFVQRIEVDTAARTLLQGVIDLGRTLGLRIVVEGVETSGQFEFLREKGANEYQGFFHSKPVREDLLYSILVSLPMPKISYQKF